MLGEYFFQKRFRGNNHFIIYEYVFWLADSGLICLRKYVGIYNKIKCLDLEVLGSHFILFTGVLWKSLSVLINLFKCLEIGFRMLCIVWYSILKELVVSIGSGILIVNILMTKIVREVLEFMDSVAFQCNFRSFILHEVQKETLKNGWVQPKT